MSSRILPNIKSDHSLLKIALLQDEERRGRGIWKLNISLQQNSQYVNLIKETIKKAKDDSKNLTNKMLIWNFVKCCIRTESISFAIKQKRQKSKSCRLNNRLTVLEQCICTCPNINLIEELETVKKEIENIYIEKARGNIVRSRCQSINEFGKPTIFFKYGEVQL